MKIISVFGGKGGTGKSFVATNLAIVLSRYRHVTLADLDVEGPNDHLLLGVDLAEEEPIKIVNPFVKYDDCIKCGVCANVCDTGAIVMTREKLPFVMARLCSGCRSCVLACPTKAILEGYRVIGYTYHTIVNNNLELVTGKLREGEEHTPPAVREGKRRALRYARDVLLIDTGAGTGSHITLAIKDSMLLIAVTEPTPLGAHDLELILEIAKEQNIPSWVVVNKYGIGASEKIFEKIMSIARGYEAEIIAKIPYHDDVARSIVERRPITSKNPDHSVSKIFNDVAHKIMGVI